MKIKYSLFVAVALMLTGCENFLDRPQLTEVNDETAWTSEENVRLYAHKYYTTFFTGYNHGFGMAGALLAGYTFSDDVVSLGNRSNVGRAVPASAIWSYAPIPSLNLMINRVQDRMSSI